MLASALAGAKADSAPDLSADRIKAHVAYLASDRLEGRGPGSRGEFLATEYIASEFKKAGLKPIGERGTYFQPVPLVRIVTSPKSTLRAVKGKTTIDIPCEEGFSGRSQTQKELEEFDAEAVFVGHGITAPEFGWDDYRNVDVKGKIVVLFTNEPPSDDPKFFGGKALTYYGRWTFKFEEAARRGAKACFIIHTNQTAGYPYSVVRPLVGAQLKREAGQPALTFAGWLSQAAGEKLLSLAGRTVEGALKEADTKGVNASFPIPALRMPARSRCRSTNDPSRSDRACCTTLVGSRFRSSAGQLFSRGSRESPQQTLRPPVASLLALPLGQPQQVLFVTQRLLLRLPCQLLVTRPERRQVQFLQAPRQRLLHLHARRRHRPPPCFRVGRRTTPGPPNRPSPASVTSPCHSGSGPPPPPTRSSGCPLLQQPHATPPRLRSPNAAPPGAGCPGTPSPPAPDAAPVSTS